MRNNVDIWSIDGYTRKKHYWRGFRACLVLVAVPLLALSVVLANLFVEYCQ